MEWKTTGIQDELTGALIGLANATRGNEDLIEAHTIELVLKGLAAMLEGSGVDDEEMKILVESVRAEKARIVPNCAACINPCGRNADYDMELLRTDREEIRSGKISILSGICRMAADGIGAQNRKNEEFLLKALRAVGDDWTAEALREMVEETERMRQENEEAAARPEQ